MRRDRERAEICVFYVREWKEGEQEGTEDGGM